MNKKIILFTLVLTGLFLIMALISVMVNKQSQGVKNSKIQPLKVNLPVEKKSKPEIKQVESSPVVVEQEAALPAGALPN